MGERHRGRGSGRKAPRERKREKCEILTLNISKSSAQTRSGVKGTAGCEEQKKEVSWSREVDVGDDGEGGAGKGGGGGGGCENWGMGSEE